MRVQLRNNVGQVFEIQFGVCMLGTVNNAFSLISWKTWESGEVSASPV